MLKDKTVEKAVHDYYNDIFYFCFSFLNDEEDARDVTQEVFLLLGEKAKELENINIRAWLYSTAKNRIMETRREKIKHSRYISLDEGGHMIADPTAEAFLDDFRGITDDEVFSAKDKLISKLSPDERALYEKIYERKLARKEIAQELQISEGAVNMRAFRLRRKIKGLVELAWTLGVIIFIKLR